MIKRKYLKKLKNELKTKEITVLVGSRQVGKTTLMKEIFTEVKNNAIYLSFDDIEILKLFETNEKLFKEEYVDPYKYIFIDEFQYAKMGGRILKYLFDSTKKKFFISGSSTPELTINSLSYLVGRIRIIEIYPIKFEEFLSYKSKTYEILLNKKRNIDEFSQIKNAFEEYLQYGSYPQIITSNLKEKEENLNFLVNSYLLKEIKEVLEYKKIFEFETIIKYLAVNDSGLLNKSNISQELEISKNELNIMLNMLEKTYIINILKPFLKNKSKEQVKSPKIYFQDTGFKNSLIKNFNKLELRKDKGCIYENFILNILKREGFEIFFWNYKNRSEMDFVIEKNGKIIGFEIKSKIKKAKITKSTNAFIKEFNPFKVFIVNENLNFILKEKTTKIEFINFFNLVILVKNEKLFN